MVCIPPRINNCMHQNKTKQNKKITNNEFKKLTYFKSSFAQQSGP